MDIKITYPFKAIIDRTISISFAKDSRDENTTEFYLLRISGFR